MSQAGIISISSASGIVDSVTGMNGVTASPTTGNVVVSGVNATTTTVGVASFNPANFTVSGAGEVSAIGGGTLTSVTTSNATPQFVLTGTVENINFGISNLLLGTSGSGITSALENVSLGQGALNALISADGCVAIGFHALLLNQSGGACVAVGLGSLAQNVSSSGNVGVGENALNALLSGTGLNTAFGNNCLENLATGTSVIGLGNTAGNNYTSSESSNIVIGNAGTAAESNVIRIGTQGSGAGQQNECFIAGITGVTTSNTQMVTINTSTGQLGSATVPGGGLQTATVTLTNAQLKALNTTAITIIAAQGAGIVIIPLMVTFKLLYGGTNAFVFSGNLETCYGTTANANSLYSFTASTFLTATANEYAIMTQSSTAQLTFSAATVENAAISVSTSAAITGNAAANNTMKVEILYYTVTL